LVQKVQDLDEKVRALKATGIFMEVAPAGLAATKRLQDATRLLLAKRYGKKGPYRVRVDLTFQESNPTFATMGEHASFLIQLAPADLLPHSVFSFLEIARQWHEQRGAFHRRAGHVLQVQTKGKQVKHLAFQEYSPQFPHVKGTVGYAGRPCKYIASNGSVVLLLRGMNLYWIATCISDYILCTQTALTPSSLVAAFSLFLDLSIT
jgi:hypothetical protein